MRINEYEESLEVRLEDISKDLFSYDNRLNIHSPVKKFHTVIFSNADISACEVYTKLKFIERYDVYYHMRINANVVYDTKKRGMLVIDGEYISPRVNFYIQRIFIIFSNKSDMVKWKLEL